MRAAFRRWLARDLGSRNPLTADDRAALRQLSAYRRFLERSQRRAAALSTVVLAATFFGMARTALSLGSPADLVATALLSAAAYPLFRVIVETYWS